MLKEKKILAFLENFNLMMKTSAKAKEKSRDCIVYLTFREETFPIIRL